MEVEIDDLEDFELRIFKVKFHTTQGHPKDWSDHYSITSM
jgi:hypothetical protein